LIYDEKTLSIEEQAWIKLRGLYEQYGYKNYRMGKFEEYMFYAQNYNFLDSDKIITFTDIDGKLMALKPDVAMSIVKNSRATNVSPEKLCYMENVYRVSKESEQFREIGQIGLEFIGEVTDYITAEIIKLSAESLKTIDEKYILSISHMGYINALLDLAKLDFSSRTKLLNCLSNKNYSEAERIFTSLNVSNNISEVFLKLVSMSSSLNNELAVKLESMALSDEMIECANDLGCLVGILKDDPILSNIIVDFSVINNTGYYNGVLFQGFLNAVPRAVLKGGRYDTLLEKMGKKGLQALGFAIYFDGLERYLKQRNEYVLDALVIYDDDSDICSVYDFVNSFVTDGKKIRAEKYIPEGIEYKKMYRVNGSEIEEVA